MLALLDAAIGGRGAPKGIRVDNGPELVSDALDRRAYPRGVIPDFGCSGKPADIVFFESFNGRLLDRGWNAV